MSYYKLGIIAEDSPAVNSRNRKLVDSANVGGALELPEPLPTIILYFIALAGAIVWVKGGGF